MDAILDPLVRMFDVNPGILLGVFVFMAASSLSFGVMATIRVRGSVKRRAAEMAIDGPRRPAENHPLRSQPA